MQQVDKFLSCDWGTSAFRLRVINTTNLEIVAEEKSSQGIANTFEQWKKSESAQNDRISFYQNIIQQHIHNLEAKLQASLDGIPLVISGMASSSIGMIEVPYKEVPFMVDGADLQIKTIPPASGFNHEILIISGVKTSDDVMRGEETKLIGCGADTLSDEEQIFVLPGTHSKHITVKNGKALQFKTYMTGEFFEVLSQESILSASVEPVKDLETDELRKSFDEGVQDSLKNNLLHSCFLVRTNQLFQKLTKAGNYCYLSGLLIGTELKEYVNQNPYQITVVCHEKLLPYYKEALNVLKLMNNTQLLPADDALIKGQYKILRNRK